MQLVTYYTDSHYQLCRRFVLNNALEFSSITVKHYGQTCISGEYASPGFDRCMLDKLHFLISLPQDSELTLYVDSDVCILPGLAAWCRQHANTMQSDEIAYGDDGEQWCAGTMLFRRTPVVHSWWQKVFKLAVEWNTHDQGVIHRLRQQQNLGEIPMSVLPGDKISNWYTLQKGKLWNGQEFSVPSTSVAWHANWCVGVETKLKMLSCVEEQVLRKGNA